MILACQRCGHEIDSLERFGISGFGNDVLRVLVRALEDHTCTKDGVTFTPMRERVKRLRDAVVNGVNRPERG